MCIFGRPIKGLIPILPGKYRPHPVWEESLLAREEALRRRHMINHEQWTQHTRLIPPLSVGDHVRIQNQMGNYPTKWDKTGVIIEVRQYHQYVIRVDSSGRITIRNCKFLRKYTPIHQPDRRRCILDDLKYVPSSNSSDQSSAPPLHLLMCPFNLIFLPQVTHLCHLFLLHLLINIYQQLKLYRHIPRDHCPGRPLPLPL